jgi:hypothetical protein
MHMHTATTAWGLPLRRLAVLVFLMLGRRCERMLEMNMLRLPSLTAIDGIRDASSSVSFDAEALVVNTLSLPHDRSPVIVASGDSRQSSMSIEALKYVHVVHVSQISFTSAIPICTSSMSCPYIMGENLSSALLVASSSNTKASPR